MERPSRGMVAFVDARARRRTVGWILAATASLGLLALFSWASPGACTHAAAEFCGVDEGCVSALEKAESQQCEMALKLAGEIGEMQDARAQELSGSELEPRVQLRARVRELLRAGRWPRLALQGPESFARALDGA